MLYAKVRSCVHTYTKATYDVHAVFSVHVCRSFKYSIIWSLLYDCLFPLFIFKFFFLVYANCIHNHVYYISLEFHWNMTYWQMLPGYSIFHQIYIRYILHIMGIPTCHWINIIWMVLRGILISLHFVTVWLYPDVYPISLHLFFVHRVHIVLTFSHWFYPTFTYTKRIHLVYL